MTDRDRETVWSACVDDDDDDDVEVRMWVYIQAEVPVGAKRSWLES